MARKPQPTEVKKIKGNPGRRKLNEDEPFVPVKKYFDPPKYILANKIAHQEWKETASILIEMQVLGVGDSKALANYCMTYALWVEALEQVQEEGITYRHENRANRGDKGPGMLKKHPLVDTIAVYSRQLMAFSSEFGLTPSSRSKFSVPRSTPDLTPESDISQFLNASEQKH